MNCKTTHLTVSILVINWVLCLIGFDDISPIGRALAESDQQATSQLRAGSAFSDITPDRVLPNYNGSLLEPGDGSRFLQAHVILCSDGKVDAAIISIDATWVGRGVMLLIRDEVHQRIGIDPDHVCVAATHAHHAPSMGPSFLAGANPDPIYIEFLVTRVGEAAERAFERMRPVKVITAALPAPPIGASRRRLSPKGQVFLPGGRPDASWPAEHPIDKQMQFVAFEYLDGEPAGLIFNFPCHNNMSGGNNYTGDMFGRAGQIIRENLGQQMATVSLAAPCGDVSYLNADDWAGGRAIAEPILKAYASGERRQCRQMTVRSIVERIPDRPFSESTFCRDNCRGDSNLPVFRKRYDPEEKAVKARGPTDCPVEVQCIAWGPVALVTNPAELFSIYGILIREASPFEVTIVAELSNGFCGYVPTQEAFRHGGYETHRTVFTQRLAKNAGDRIERLSIDRLNQAWQELHPDP